VGGQSLYRLRQCQFAFTQATDPRGRAAAKVRHGLLHLTLDVPDDDQLLDWANTVHKTLAGHVTFFEDDHRTARETPSFAAGQCVSYQETFVAGDGQAGACASCSSPAMGLRWRSQAAFAGGLAGCGPSIRFRHGTHCPG